MAKTCFVCKGKPPECVNDGREKSDAGRTARERLLTKELVLDEYGAFRKNLSQLKADLWEAADQLCANSKLTSSEYCMPVLGVIFLRHATNRYDGARAEIERDQAEGKMPKRALIKADFLKRRALMLPKEARYDEILRMPKGSNLGAALVEAMNAIERDFEPLQGQLPKDYDKFENDLLEDLLRIFDSEVLRIASG